MCEVVMERIVCGLPVGTLVEFGEVEVVDIADMSAGVTYDEMA
jgi:hypothetical protein